MSWKLLEIVLFSLFCNIAACHILRLPCKEYGNFSVAKENFVLQGSVLRTILNISSAECEQQCLLNNKCKSINVEEGNKTCELNANSTVDLIVGENALVAKSNWIYKSTSYNDTLVGENCQAWKPCLFGQICMDLCECPFYECINGWKDCKAAKEAGIKANGVYKISNNGFPQQWLTVFCDMATDEGGWIVFQRRIDNTVDFYRNWSEYKQGFGLITGNYWLGLDKLRLLAAPGRGAVLRVDIRHSDDANKVYAYYSKFEIGNEAGGYLLKISGYEGNAGDSLAWHNNMKFSTYDRDNDLYFKNCAQIFTAAWWYNACFASNLNGQFPSAASTDPKYMSWKSVKNSHGNIVFSEMKLRYL